MNQQPTLRQRAQAEIEAEARRAAVEAEKARIRAHRSTWQRIVDRLPFTIVIKRKARPQ